MELASYISKRHIMVRVKLKVIPQQAEVAQGVPGRLTRDAWRGGYFDPTRIHFSAVGIFLGIITRQFTYLLLHSSPYLTCH